MAGKFRILLVDDEKRILNFLNSKLRVLGYEVAMAGDGVEALEKFHDIQPDLIVLDLVMPKKSGLDVLREIRSFSKIPIIILSAKGDDVNRIEGLKLGADDYIPKPFNPDELVARIEAIRRRLEPGEKPQLLEHLTFGDVTIDFKNHSVVVRGEGKYLTRIEWLLLGELARNAGRLMPYEVLLTRVWGTEYRDDITFLRTWISRIRSKLENNPGDPKLIRTIPKTGYIIDQPHS